MQALPVPAMKSYRRTMHELLVHDSVKTLWERILALLEEELILELENQGVSTKGSL